MIEIRLKFPGDTRRMIMQSELTVRGFVLDDGTPDFRVDFLHQPVHSLSQQHVHAIHQAMVTCEGFVAAFLKERKDRAR
jgi:hypothetical protein